jgi:hypothetical protein
MQAGSRAVHLNGSINLPSTDAVFDAVNKHLREDVRSVPDGETGERKLWVAWELKRIAELPELEVVDHLVFQTPGYGELHVPLLKVADGVDPAQVRLGPFRYTGTAKASYQRFLADRDAGRFVPGTRFQVAMPTPMMFAMNFPTQRRDVLPAFERDLMHEVSAILGEIPSGDLALQWDVSGEVVIQQQFRIGAADTWEGAERWPLSEATDSLLRVMRDIPEEVLLGIHTCFGDPDGDSLVEAEDLRIPVEIANTLSRQLARRLDWVHMPVPIEHDDEAYFAPLADLKLKPETELYLGLVHKEDGSEGAGRRIAAASKFFGAFGVATECGMGREPEEEIDGLLELHHEVATSLA